MHFHNIYKYELDTDLCTTEKALKTLYLENAERHLDQPHDINECRDIFIKACQIDDTLFPKFLATNLEEDLFFHKNLDCEIYHHFRYLPCNWHTHSFLEVLCVLRGSCSNYIADQKLDMQTGDICIIAPNTKHAVSVFSDDCIVFNILLRTSTFEASFFGTLSENDMLSDFFMRTLYHSSARPYLLFRTKGDSEVFNYISRAYEEFSGNHAYKKRMLNSIIDTFFITLLRRHVENIIFPKLTEDDQNENLIFILKYMQEHFATITLKELAAFFNYSERQLQKILKSNTGMSFSENILQLRMNHATLLLSDHDIPIAVIAEKLGYSDTCSFRQVFKKCFAMTPLEYRNRI